MTSRVTCSPREVTASEFPPHELRDYALLADGERGAAIGPRGEVAWVCAPRWESGSVFSSLIGVYAISPATRFRLERVLRARVAHLAQQVDHR